MEKTDDERRRERRVKTQLRLVIRYNDRQLDSSTRNISLLGACVDTKEQILPGTRVGIFLNLPNYRGEQALAGEVRGEGAIVRCDPSPEAEVSEKYEVGVFFSSFIGTDEEKLSQFLDFMVKKQEEEVQKWAQQYKARIEKRRKEIAAKKRLAALAKAKRKKKKAKKKTKTKAKKK